MSELTSAQIQADYEAAFARRAQWIEVGRTTGSTPSATFRAKCRARVWGYRPEQLVGSVSQGEITVKALVSDLIKNRFPLPVTTNDTVYVQGQQRKIVAVDNNKGRHGNDQIYVWISASG